MFTLLFYYLPFIIPFLLVRLDKLFNLLQVLIFYYISVFTDYKLYNITSSEIVSSIRNKLKKSEKYSQEGKPVGISFNIPFVNFFLFFFWKIEEDTLTGEFKKNDLENDFFILEIYTESKRNDKFCIYIFCNKKTLDKLSSFEKKDNKLKKVISLYELGGESFWREDRFIKDTIDLTKFIATKEQNIICNILMDHLDENNCTSALLSGPPGSGKSSILEAFSSKLVDKNIKVSVIKPDFTSPGITLNSVISSIDMDGDEDHKILIFIDEIDILFESVLKGIKQHDSCPISVKDKRELNSLLDTILKKKNCSIIGTTNQSISTLVKLESSFMRRFLFKFNMHSDISNEETVFNVPIKEFPYKKKIDYLDIKCTYCV